MIFSQNPGHERSQAGYNIRVPGFHAQFRSSEIQFGMKRANVRLTFPSSNPDVVPVGVQKAKGNVNYLLGERENWRTNLALFQSIRYSNLYPGIDLEYMTSGGVLKSEFYIQPGSDPAKIAMQLEADGAISINESGVLVIVTPGGTFEEQAPVSYQLDGENKVVIGSRFVLRAANVVGIELEEYDREKLLVVDPLLSFSTFVGGHGGDAITSVAIAADNTIYVAGTTDAADFPTAVPRQSASGGGVDGFVMHLASNGSTILYSTYLGGRGEDRITSIKVDSAGKVFVAGCTTSSNFPTASPRQVALSGSRDAFVTGLSASGQTLLFSTYFGGSGSECANGLALDGSGGVLIAGETTSSNFPVLSAMQSSSAGGSDGFFAKFTDTGTLIFSSYFGGNGDDRILGLALDASRNIYLTGSTTSPSFPLLSPIQSALSGSMDAFVTKVNAAGTAKVYSTYLGGTGGSLSQPEAGYAISVGSTGNAYIAGITYSSDFPLATPAQATYSGFGDGFAVKLNAAGSGLDLSTYVGGNGQDMLLGIIVDSDGGFQVVGSTQSSNLAVSNAVQTTRGGSTDILFGQYAATGSLRTLSYFGGSDMDAGYAIAADSRAGIFLAGQTASANLPLRNPLQSFNVGSSSAFLIKVVEPPKAVSVTPQSSSGAARTFTFVASGSPAASSLASVGLLINSTATAANACYLVYNQAQNTIALATDNGSSFPSALSGSNTVLTNSQCSVGVAQLTTAASGQNLSVAVTVNFKPAFDGPKNLYVIGIDTSGTSSAFQNMGTFLVAATPVAPTASVNPTSVTGFSKTVQFTFGDANGSSDISFVLMNINPFLGANNSCYFVYERLHNVVALANDAATEWSSQNASQPGTLQNSQCSIQTRANSVTVTDTTIILALQITFSANAAGSKNIYMYAIDAAGLTAGFTVAGAWSAYSSLPAVSGSPASGAGQTGTFQFSFSNADGSNTLTAMLGVINPNVDGLRSCYFYFDKIGSMMGLANDTVDAWSSLPVAQGGTVQNSQCRIQMNANAVSTNATAATITLTITFFSSYAGPKNIYLWGATNSGLNTGFQQVGTFNVLY